MDEEKSPNTREESTTDAESAKSGEAAELHEILSLGTVERALGNVLDERFTRLLGLGIRYPLTNADPLKTILLGGYLLSPLLAVLLSMIVDRSFLDQFLAPFGELVAPIVGFAHRTGIGGIDLPAFNGLLLYPLALVSIPVIGYLVYVVANVLEESHAMRAFPAPKDVTEWKKLSIVGVKGTLILAVCLFAPLAFISDMVGGIVGATITQFLGLAFRQRLVAIGAVVVVCFYPAAIGTFVRHGRLSAGINASTRSMFVNREYLRCVAVMLALLVVTGSLVEILIAVFGWAAVVMVGPVVFYQLAAIHYVIGLTWRAVEEDDEIDDLLSSGPILEDRSSRTDAIVAALGERSDRDLYEISTWDPRTRIDRLAVRIYDGGKQRPLALLSVYLIAIGALVISAWIDHISQWVDVGTWLLTFVPSIAVMGYVWIRFATPETSAQAAGITVLLGAAFATFSSQVIYITPSIATSTTTTIFEPIYRTGFSGVVLVTFLFAVPLLEIGKLLAVRFYAYRNRQFTTVVDGAVYGAAAGLGFVPIVNAGIGLWPTTDTVLLTALFATLNVLFGAFTGYYLGLAKFNPATAGPIVIKGLIIVVAIRSVVEMLYRELNNYLLHAGMRAAASGEGPEMIELLGVTVRGQRELLGWTVRTTTIVLLAYLAICVGLLLIVLSRKLYAYSTLYRTVVQDGDTSVVEDTSRAHADERVAELQRLREAGILSDREFHELRARI